MADHLLLSPDGCLSSTSSRSRRSSPPISKTACILLSLDGLGTLITIVSPCPRHFPCPRSPRPRRLSKFAVCPATSTSFHFFATSLIHLRSPTSFFPFYTIPSSLINRRIVRLRRHRGRCLRFLTARYPILEAAKGSKWYQQYRLAQVRIDYLQRQA